MISIRQMIPAFSMARRAGAIAITCSLAMVLSAAEDKPTSLSDARAAVEANLKTNEGKAYDQQFGKEFLERYPGTVKQCKQAAGDDLASFWILVKLAKEGTVREVLLYPKTKIGSCTSTTLLKDRFSPPPKPDYWVSVYLKLSH